MKIIGLTGSIAMGKSEVAKIFQQRGYPVFDSDAEVHKLYDSSEGAELLRELAPEATSMGHVDRKILSNLVTADAKLLSQLEPIVHAEIRRRRDEFVTFARQRGAKLVVLDIPLLFEVGADKHVDAIIVVSSNADQQKQRALARLGMTTQRFDMILQRQMPDAEKRKRATFVIENNETLDELKTATLDLIRRLTKDLD